MKFIVDRIESNVVVVEFGDIYLDIPMECFKGDVSEGDVLYLSADKEETESCKSAMSNRLNKLFNKTKN